MSALMNVLMVIAYAAAVHAIWVSPSAWIAADREKWAWILLLAIPGINVLVLPVYAIGVLPLLLPQHTVSRNHPMRRGSHGGHATTTGYPDARTPFS